MSAVVEHLSALARGESLTAEEAASAMRLVMSGEATPIQVAGFLVALRVKGETAEEITGFARTVREMATRVDIDGELLDTCGTGGDSMGTFNVSTLSAIVAAGAGARVAKHGNRAASSACGSADVLEALGVRIDLGPEGVAECIRTCGIAFLFAPRFHPAFRHAAVPRRELGIRTVFNILGPLCNPAGATRQALGVADGSIADRMAEVLVNLGVAHALVFHSPDGMDELGLSGPSRVVEVVDGRRSEYEVDPAELGLERAPAAALLGGTPSDNADLARQVLAGDRGPRRDVVLLNTAAALRAGGIAADWQDGVRRAADSIDSGAAARTLDRWIATSRAVAP